jgi:predicted neuraminidase
MQGRPMAHCATLAVLPDNSLISAWFAGTEETAPDVSIMMSRMSNSPGVWEAPQIIVDIPNCSLGQPVFLVQPNGELWLFFDVIDLSIKPNQGKNFFSDEIGDVNWSWYWQNSQTYFQASQNDGLTWSKPQQLIDYPGLMFRSKPITLSDRIILPVYDERKFESRMLVSNDQGISWRLTNPIQTTQGNIHPCVVQLSNGNLLAYLRTGGSGGVIWRTYSDDLGETWAKPTPTKIPNPNSGIDLIRSNSGNLILAFNNSSKVRSPLCVMVGDDDENWSEPKVIMEGEGEFSYPTLIQSNNQSFHLVYTFKRECIHYASFTESWLCDNDINNEGRLK